MAKKLCAVLFVVALGLGLWAQSTLITVGDTQIEITEPDFPAPKLDEAQVAQLNFFDSDEVVMRAVYGDPKVVEAMVREGSDLDVSIKNPFFMAFSVTSLDGYDLSDMDFDDMAANMASGIAQGIGSVEEGEDSELEAFIILGESIRTRYSLGVTLLVKEKGQENPAIMVICPTMVKGKLLMLLAGMEYRDNLSINKVERYLRGWSADIYSANPAKKK